MADDEATTTPPPPAEEKDEDNTPAAAEIIDQFKGKQNVDVKDFIEAHFY